MQKSPVSIYSTASFEKQSMKHKQKKPFVNFINELSEAVNLFLLENIADMGKNKYRMIFKNYHLQKSQCAKKLPFCSWKSFH